jgi:hypothetical protein
MRTALLLMIALASTTAKAQDYKRTINRYSQEVVITPDPAIQMKKFTARREGGKVYLNWVVFNNLKSGMYVIERAIDGKNYEVIGFKKGIASSLPLDLAFYFTDDMPVQGNATYKVMHISDDNSYFESHPVVVKTEKKQMALDSRPAVRSVDVYIK